MKKYLKTTLGRKLLAFYLVLFAITFYLITTVGRDYISERVESESISNLRSVGITLLGSHINEQRYTKTTILSLRDQLKMASEAAEAEILIVCSDGDVILNTDTEKTYNIYQGSSSFLHEDVIKDTTLSGLLSENSTCVILPMEQSAYLNGYLVLAQPDQFINNRAIYYTNILTTFFYLIMVIVGFVFLLIYVFNVRPLRKLRKGASQFSINHENPPILIKSQDEYGELAKTLNVIGAELSKFDEYQRKFISNISHDFRSPLTSIQGYVQAMKDGVIPADNQEKYLDIILYETERMTKLTSNLIDMNNYDRDNIMLEQESFDIHKAVKMTCESLEGTASNKQITFTYNLCEPEELLVYADKQKILQVLRNLCDNAIKFSHEESEICLHTFTKGEKVFISIKDSGIGIPREDLNLIWDRFYKTDLSRGKDKLGSGLGLAICREIINAHKQTIDVVSTVGVGSEFVFTLPKA